MIIDILARDPDGVAVLLRPMLSDEPPNLQEHLRRDPLQNPDPPSLQLSWAITQRMKAAAVRVDPDGALNVAGRVLLIDRIHPRYYFALMRDGVVLDSHPYGGYTTSLDALVIGSPVLTLPHPELARGRATSALLTAMEMPELIADNQADFVEIALRLGHDPAWYVPCLPGMPTATAHRDCPLRLLTPTAHRDCRSCQRRCHHGALSALTHSPPPSPGRKSQVHGAFQESCGESTRRDQGAWPREWRRVDPPLPRACRGRYAKRPVRAQVARTGERWWWGNGAMRPKSHPAAEVPLERHT